MLLLVVLGKNYYYYCSNLGVGKKTLKNLKPIFALYFSWGSTVVQDFHLTVNKMGQKFLYAKAEARLGFFFFFTWASKQLTKNTLVANHP